MYDINIFFIYFKEIEIIGKIFMSLENLFRMTNIRPNKCLDIIQILTIITSRD